MTQNIRYPFTLHVFFPWSAYYRSILTAGAGEEGGGGREGGGKEKTGLHFYIQKSHHKGLAFLIIFLSLISNRRQGKKLNPAT